MNAVVAETTPVEEGSTNAIKEPQRTYLREIILSPMAGLGARLGCNVFIKREDLQAVRSFKIRGAYHKMHKLRSLAAATGVVCASAGNHAQGVALSSRKLMLTATVVMPITTPEIKINAVRALGAAVILQGLNFDEADRYARELKSGGALYIPPFDDPDIIAGQGTVARLFCDGIITVSSDEICAAIKDIFEDLRAVAEPAGALALAGLKRYARGPRGKGNLAAVLSGGNLNFDALRYVSERCELGEGREAVFAVSIPECKGSFRRLCSVLGNRAITEFNYRYAFKKLAVVFIGISLKRGAQELAEVENALRSEGYEFQNLSDYELAKLHVRHMIGGAATGSCLAAFELEDEKGIGGHLESMGIKYRLVSENAAFKAFLGGAR